MTAWPPEELDMQAMDNQCCKPFQVLTSVLLVRRGWFANQSPEPTAVGAVSSAIAVPAASRRWLSFFR